MYSNCHGEDHGGNIESACAPISFLYGWIFLLVGRRNGGGTKRRILSSTPNPYCNFWIPFALFFAFISFSKCRTLGVWALLLIDSLYLIRKIKVGQKIFHLVKPPRNITLKSTLKRNSYLVVIRPVLLYGEIWPLRAIEAN